MKRKIYVLIICNLVICMPLGNLLIAQNITNTLGSSGTFTIKDGSASYLTLSQSTGQINILKTLRLENTTSSTTGIIFKGLTRFLHDYRGPASTGANTFLGINAGNFTMSGSGFQGSDNTGIGYNSLLSLTTGYRNTGLGSSSLYSNTSGIGNTAVGNVALFSNATGQYNTAIGTNSLYYNTSGNVNTAIGYNSLTVNTIGEYNTATGSSSLFSNTTGSFNVAFGSGALYSNTTGSYNSSFGYESLTSSTTGERNSAFGYLSLTQNTGERNSAFGYQSLSSNTTGVWNSAFGYQSLNVNTVGVVNSAFGYSSLLSNSTGSNNSAFGYLSLSSNTTGTNNTGIGYNAQVPSGTSSNQVRIGNTSVTYAGVQVAWTITSDRRWKSNISNSNLGLDFISKLRPVSYTRKNDESGKNEYGFIAQEIEEVLKEENIENTGMLTITDEGMYEFRYNDLFAPMVKAIQELKAENDILKEEIQSLKTIEERLTELEHKIAEQNNLKKVKLTEK